MKSKRTRVRSQESQLRNSTPAVDDPGALSAFDVLLDAPRGAERSSITVRCAGLNKADAAKRARWQVARDRGVSPDRVHVLGSTPVPS